MIRPLYLAFGAAHAFIATGALIIHAQLWAIMGAVITVALIAAAINGAKSPIP